VRSIGLRADMDALPMREENDFAWRSASQGLMHGCGHDGHTTMLLGAARYLAQTRQFKGTVVLIFQPGEEGFAGAKAMIDDGLFDRFPIDAVYAMHNWPSMSPGTIGLNPGPMMAAADRFEITIQGRGGHGAHPYMAIDPVLVAGHIITAAQSLVSRNVNPLDSAVLSICAMQAGDVGAFNVIPRQAQLIGTARSFRREVQDMIEERLGRLVESVALGFGAGSESRRPLGLAVVGGLMFSQLLTLYITPVFYIYMDQLQRWFESRKHREAPHSEDILVPAGVMLRKSGD